MLTWLLWRQQERHTQGEEKRRHISTDSAPDALAAASELSYQMHLQQQPGSLWQALSNVIVSSKQRLLCSAGPLLLKLPRCPVSQTFSASQLSGITCSPGADFRSSPTRVSMHQSTLRAR